MGIYFAEKNLHSRSAAAIALKKKNKHQLFGPWLALCPWLALKVPNQLLSDKGDCEAAAKVQGLGKGLMHK